MITISSVFFFKGDNLLVIGGFWYNHRLSNIERLSDFNGLECGPSDLIDKVGDHATVSSSRGLITCGGEDEDLKMMSKCQLNGEINSFPSMIEKRMEFGMLIVNDIIFAIGGTGSKHTMETIDLNGGTKWTKMKLPFGVSDHCVVSVGSKILVIGGFFFPIGSTSGYVSGNLLPMKENEMILNFMQKMLLIQFEIEKFVSQIFSGNE